MKLFTLRNMLFIAGGLAAILVIILTILFSSSDRPQQTSLSDPARKHRAEQITSSFENSTLDLQYDYAEDIGDGNGITAGRAGFTSGTADLLEVVQSYAKLKPGNPVAKYIPALQKVNGTKDTTGLEGFAGDWKQANQDQALHDIQDQEVDKLYFDPAIRQADKLGIRTALGQAIIWDTWIQHGGGDAASGGPDGAGQVVAETIEATGGNVDGDEADWLQAFLKIRLQHLYHMYGSTIDDKDSSKSRVAAWQSLIKAKKFNLDRPLAWKAYGDSYSL